MRHCLNGKPEDKINGLFGAAWPYRYIGTTFWGSSLFSAFPVLRRHAEVSSAAVNLVSRCFCSVVVVVCLEKPKKISTKRPKEIFAHTIGSVR